MIKIRNGAFETNSSMTHSLILMSDDEYNKWETGEYYLDERNDCIISREEAEQRIIKICDKKNYVHPQNEDKMKRWFMSQDIYSYDDYVYNDYYEYFDCQKKVDGVTVHAVGRYGND